MILRGLLLLARGRADGLKEFGNTQDALFASLAPLIAFPMVGATMTAIEGRPVAALAAFLARLCAVLALPLITYEFARVIKREAFWLRTATALNWAFWLIIPLLLAGAFLGAGLTAGGISMWNAELAAIAVALVCLLWLQWFIVRKGLEIGGWLALLLVLLNAAAIAVCTAVPIQLTGL